MKTNLKVELQNALIYTRESIARVLGVTVKRIRRTMLWWAGFGIWVEGKRPRLYKKSLFTAEYANFRQNGAKNYKVTYVPQCEKTNIEIYRVERKADDRPVMGQTSQHSVRTTTVSGTPLFTCECEDYIKASEAFKAPACKHIYAVLNYKGFKTLKEAIELSQKHYGQYVAVNAADAKAAIGL
jgi:hypothetical protein